MPPLGFEKGYNLTYLQICERKGFYKVTLYVRKRYLDVHVDLKRI